VASSTVIIYKPAVDAFRGWTGPVGRSVLRLAREMRTQQITLVGKQSGRLAQSITVGRRGRWARGIETTVGANAGVGRGRTGYAVWNDQGTLPHSIYPRRAPQLVFYWAKVGRVVHPALPGAERVGSPGTPITRSLVVGDTLYTISAAGVKGSSLATFADRGFASLPPGGLGGPLPTPKLPPIPPTPPSTR